MLRSAKRVAEAISRATAAPQSLQGSSQASAASHEAFGDRVFRAGMPLAAGTMVMLGLAEVSLANEVADGMEAPSYPWWHVWLHHCYDHGAIRRGH